MSDDRLELALITARGGSKGVPGKNLRQLGDQPLIAWTIAAALDSGRFRDVIVSTDDDAIAATAREAGAQTPFMRPDELASDSASSLDVVRHALDQTGCTGDFALLQPTSPFRDAGAISRACAVYRERRPPALVSVVRAKPPEWLLRVDNDGHLHRFFANGAAVSRRQDGEVTVQPNGAIYIIGVQTFVQSASFLPSGTLPFEMGTIDSLDIDTEEDFAIAEAIVSGGVRTP